MTCATCANCDATTYRVPVCRKASTPNACVLAVERAIRAHWQRTKKWVDKCPMWKAK